MSAKAFAQQTSRQTTLSPHILLHALNQHTQKLPAKLMKHVVNQGSRVVLFPHSNEVKMADSVFLKQHLTTFLRGAGTSCGIVRQYSVSEQHKPNNNVCW